MSDERSWYFFKRKSLQDERDEIESRYYDGQEDQTDTGVDIDEDYLTVGESKRAGGCYTDDPEKEALPFDRSQQGNNLQSRREMDANEYEHNSRFADDSPAETLWDGNHPNAYTKDGPKYRLQMDMFVKDALADTFGVDTYERDTVQYLTTFITQTFPEKTNGEIERIMYLIRDDPRMGNGWNVKGGYEAAIVGYAAHIADWDDPVEEVTNRLDTDVFFNSSDEIEEAVNYAQKQIENRGIDVEISNY